MCADRPRSSRRCRSNSTRPSPFTPVTLPAKRADDPYSWVLERKRADPARRAASGIRPGAVRDLPALAPGGMGGRVAREPGSPGGPGGLDGRAAREPGGWMAREAGR
ncbi:hypothetical protein GCM10010439_28710 [Actinocorallia aurantiaca]|uniref:Uncharacterized protein n=1 Tax=Actinocorallia aurantiaca TaxID=46204 RepID=A0ABP6GRA6_9ACTN